MNIPSVEMVKVTDYCGIFSGRDKDKSKLFHIFYGELETAPMIMECPINIECSLLRILDFEIDEVFIGAICQSYSEQK